MPHNPDFTPARMLAVNASASPWDVLKAKAALNALGHYDAPDWGLSPFPDSALFAALEAFQRQAQLKPDAAMKPGGETADALARALTAAQAQSAARDAARALQDMGRNGDTALAHVTPEEAAWLDAVTDGASINPVTGLLEFWQAASGDDEKHERYRREQNKRRMLEVRSHSVRQTHHERGDDGRRDDGDDGANERVKPRRDDDGADDRHRSTSRRDGPRFLKTKPKPEPELKPELTRLDDPARTAHDDGGDERRRRARAALDAEDDRSLAGRLLEEKDDKFAKTKDQNDSSTYPDFLSGWISQKVQKQITKAPVTAPFKSRVGSMRWQYDLLFGGPLHYNNLPMPPPRHEKQDVQWGAVRRRWGLLARS